MRTARLLSLLLLAAIPALALEIKLVPIATGLASPVGITHVDDDSGRLFVTLRDGRIMVIRNGVVVPTPFLDLRSIVLSGGEQGLLGLAFHPQYTLNGFFYVNYTDLAGDTVIARYRVSPFDHERADPNSAKVLLRIDQPFANHNGGQLAFGPDGFLYIATGDGGSGGDPGNRAQSLGTLLGKILRIDVDSGDPYAIPPTNPFAGSPGARGEIWAYGLRNPWRFSFDRDTGDLFIGDVGQGQWEEVNFQPAFSGGGENWGWRCLEGTHPFNTDNCNLNVLEPPILEYGHHEGPHCSVTGGFRYRGLIHPDLQGVYFYGDFCSGWIFGARETPSGWTTELLIDTELRISSFGEDQAGEIYVADIAGTIWRIASGATPARRRLTTRP